MKTLIRDAIVAIVQIGQAAGRPHRGLAEHRQGDFPKEPFVAQKADHLADHALNTWLSCTLHVADHAMIMQLPCTGHMTDHALIT